MVQTAFVAAALRSYLTSRANSIIAIAIIALVATAIWSWAAPYNFIPCYSDCGETFISHHYAKQFNLYGLKFGLLEDHATSPSIAAHPLLYTHNVNLGGLSFVLYEAMGLTSVAAKQFMVLLTFCASLFLMFRTALYYSRSSITAFIVLVVAATDFGSFVTFALHASRVWAWVGLSGILLFSGRLAEDHGARSTNVLGLILFDCIAFGLGYEFWMISSVISVFVVGAFALKDFSTKRFILLISIACMAALVPFLLRQIHVAAVMGTAYWAKDFLYSFAIKLPMMGLIISLPSLPEIAEFYRANQVMQWRGAAPDQSVAAYANQLVAAYRAFSTVILQNTGLLTFVISYCLVVVPGILLIRPNTSPDGQTPKEQLQIDRPLRLYFSLAAGMLVGSLAILKMVIPFYLAMHMPLFGIVFVLAKGFFLGLLVHWAVRLQRRGRTIVFIVCGLIVADHAAIQVSTAQNTQPMETRWIDAVQATPNATYAVSFLPLSVSSFTKNWTIGVQWETQKERIYLERLADGQAPFRKDDLIIFGERDAERLNWPYLRPDFWLYFPIDQSAAYFSPANTCRKTYLHRAYSTLSSRWRAPKALFIPLSKSPIPPGGRLDLRAQIVNPDLVRSIQILVGGNLVGSLRVSCIHNFAVGTFDIPTNLGNGIVKVEAWIEGPTEDLGKTITVGSIRVVSGVVQPQSNPLSRNQLTVPEVLAKYPQLDVVKVQAPDKYGAGYLVIRLPPKR